MGRGGSGEVHPRRLLAGLRPGPAPLVHPGPDARRAARHAAATDTSIKVWDLENKAVLDELTSTAPPKCGIPWCVSLSWSADGNTLFAGSTDGSLYVYEVGQA